MGERRGEADPYAWLSVTAPASPRHSLRELSSQISTDRESDPGTQQSSSMWPRRSMRKTKKAGEGGRRQEDESDGETSPPTSISRTGSVAKLHKVARKIKSAMGTGHDTGQLPAVRRARPNMEEYEAMSSKPASRASSISRSLSARSGSDESLSSPEQRTVTRRIVPVESSRPTVQTLFESGQTISGPVVGPAGEISEQQILVQPGVRGEPTLLVATLPDGSTMTSEGGGEPQQ